MSETAMKKTYSKRSMIFSIISIFVLIPLTLFLGYHLSGRTYYLTSTLVIIEILIPFFLMFETRKPQARELVTIAILAALAVIGRVAIPIPNFKAITGIIMISGMAFGTQAGFLVGAVAAFAANFFYSQGPWTPWQMLAYGLAGFLAGLVFCGRDFKFKKSAPKHAAVMAVFGFVVVVCIIGPLLDVCTIFTAGSVITKEFAIAIFTSGFPYNIIHGIGTAVTLFIIGRPLLGKLDRIKTKYGMMEASRDGV